jgi:putative lipoic acid-binding regulatory protein
MTLEHSLIEFPSDFPIKVFGLAHEGFTQAVIEVISAYDPEFKASSIETRNSKTARYVSLTCTVRATSREQLDAIYQALCDHPMVAMAL